MIADVRKWFYYPISMPLTKDNQGPAAPSEFHRMVYEVWDRLHRTHGSYDYLPDAIEKAIELNLENCFVSEKGYYVPYDPS